ncbi:MAG TPA: M20/M25/M40 family metallo-hydrolase [Vicinamibacterales bacterium]|jgi:hypothetical protein
MKARCLLPIALAAAVVGVGSAQIARPVSPVSADFVASGPVVPLTPPLATALEGLRATALAAHIAYLSAPSLEGRGLSGRGLDATAEYLAASLALMGISPAIPAEKGNPSAPYFHLVPLREISRMAGRVAIETRRPESTDAQTFQSGIDCLFPELAPQQFAAPVVFAGYGIRETSPARDDYRGLDVRGKIVLILAGLPAGHEWNKPELVARYGADDARPRFAAKAQLASSLGARAVLAIETDASISALTVNAQAPVPAFFVPVHENEWTLPPVIRVSERVGDRLLAGVGSTSAAARTQASRPLPGAIVTVQVSADERATASRNVVGMIPGADPAHRDEAVILGAHMDHLGRSGANWYPGADDNASGVAAVLEIARVFASPGNRPKRTLIFAFWTGEEEGHLGSTYYVQHPLWPLERTTVYLNLDMIGHPWTAQELRTLVGETHLEHGSEFLVSVKPADFIELGVAESATDLGPVLAQAARGIGVALHLDRTDGKSGGSDYREFAREGRPFVRFFGNYFDGYHEPSDTIEKLDVSQVLKMTRLAFASTWLLANR